MANDFPFSDPVAITRSAASSLGVEMADLRRGLSGLSQPMYAGTAGAISGVFPDGTNGAGIANALQGSVVSGRTLGFNAGNYAIDRGAGNLYLGMAYQTWTLTLDQGDAVNPRIDMVVIRHADPGLSGETSTTQSAWPVILKGSPAATPVKPTAQMTAADVPLLSCTVGGGSNANAILALTDERQIIVTRGGIYPRHSNDARPGAYEGHYRDNVANDNLERWSGTAWEPVASPAVWTTFTPRLIATGTNTDINIGTNAIKTCRYQLLGKTLRFQYFFKWGAQPWNGGSGAIYTLLPTGYVAADNTFTWWFSSHLWVNNAQGTVGDIGGWGWMRGGTNKLQPSFPVTANNLIQGYYTIANAQGAGNTGCPQVNAYPEGGELAISGQIEVQ